MEVTDLKESEAALRAAKIRAESADRAKSDFLEVMSHEIRTPLNSVIGFISFSRSSQLTEEQAQFVKIIETSGEGLLEIINDVLDISKIEAGRMELSLEAVETTMLAHEVVALMASRADETGVRLEIQFINELPEEVKTDRARLRQILINLVGNAIKFTAEGSVILEMGYGPDSELHCKVTDTGIGIPPEGIDRLFKEFSQVDSSTTRDFGGTGLGLVICKRLSEAMGGAIAVTIESGKGSCFAFHIEAPRVEPISSDLADLADVVAVPIKSPDDNPRILVVDDNPINRKVFGSTLKVAGYAQVEFAFDGLQALEAARKELPDIIFMDVEMPLMDGMTATTEIRGLARSTGKTTWIIGLSANVWPDTVRRSEEVGMNNYLVKPVRRHEVVAAINERERSD